MKNKLVIGNWKMNLSFEEANDLIIAIGDALEGFHTNSEVVLSPSFVYLELATDLAEEYNFSIAAQIVANMKTLFIPAKFPPLC